jgi:hypothetical protein
MSPRTNPEATAKTTFCLHVAEVDRVCGTCGAVMDRTTHYVGIYAGAPGPSTLRIRVCRRCVVMLDLVTRSGAETREFLT